MRRFAVLAAALMLSTIGGGEVVVRAPRRVRLDEDQPRPPPAPSIRDHSFDREVAEWNAEVDRRKAEKKAAKKARRQA